MGPHSPAARSEGNRWSWGQSVNAGDSRVCGRRSARPRPVTAGGMWMGWGGVGSASGRRHQRAGDQGRKEGELLLPPTPGWGS